MDLKVLKQLMLRHCKVVMAAITWLPFFIFIHLFSVYYICSFSVRISSNTDSKELSHGEITIQGVHERCQKKKLTSK
jgi:hypothetical protein